MFNTTDWQRSWVCRPISERRHLKHPRFTSCPRFIPIPPAIFCKPNTTHGPVQLVNMSGPPTAWSSGLVRICRHQIFPSDWPRTTDLIFPRKIAFSGPIDLTHRRVKRGRLACGPQRTSRSEIVLESCNSGMMQYFRHASILANIDSPPGDTKNRCTLCNIF